MQVALVENANTANIVIITDGNYWFTLPDGSQISPVYSGWVGQNYRVCDINFAVPVPTYLNAVSLGGNSGIGYTNGNILTISGGTSQGNVAQLQVSGIGSNGIVTSLIIANSGYYTVNPNTPNRPTGGTGTGLEVNLEMAIHEANTVTYTYNANTNVVNETNTYKTPVIDNTTSLERQRQADLSGDPANATLKDKLRTATRAQIDTWLLNNVTNLAEARNVLGGIIKFLANKYAGDA